jgi:hypothetical protein
MKRNARLFSCAQIAIARPQNSRRLSERITLGNPRSTLIRSRSLVTHTPEIAVSGAIVTDSCVASSTTVRHFKDRPSASRSNTKSMLQTSLARRERTRVGFDAF